MRSRFVALILNSILVQTESKTESWFERKMCLKIANQFKPSHPPGNLILTPLLFTAGHPSLHSWILAVRLPVAWILKWMFDKKLLSERYTDTGFPATHPRPGPAHGAARTGHSAVLLTRSAVCSSARPSHACTALPLCRRDPPRLFLPSSILKKKLFPTSTSTERGYFYRERRDEEMNPWGVTILDSLPRYKFCLFQLLDSFSVSRVRSS